MSNELEFKNVFYFRHINELGGVESFMYYLAQIIGDMDIVFVYNHGDEKQLNKLRRKIRCVQYLNGMKIKCDKIFFNYNADIINAVDAKEYIRVLHCIYEKEPTLPKDEEKITRYIGVSQAVCDSWYRVTGKKAELCYNPVNREPFVKIMHLVSATRWSSDKGGGRMQTLATMLDNAGIPYIWDIFTNDFSKVDSPNVFYHEPSVNASGYFRTADYVVQLSNDEGYGYVPVEALQQGVPVIVTPFSVLDELGIKDGENAIVLPFDMKNIDVWDIYNRIGTFKFKYEPRTGDWRKLMSPGKGTYQENMSYVYKVRFTKNYEKSRMIDAVKLRRVKEGEECVVDYNRYLHLLNHPRYGQLAELVEKIKI